MSQTVLRPILSALMITFLAGLGCSPAVEKLWEFPTPSPIYSSPLVMEELIVFGSEGGTLHAVDHRGKARWRYSVPSGKIFSRPVTDGQLIFFGSTSQTFYAVDMSGRLRWQFAAGERIKSDAAVSEGVAYTTSYDGHVYALSADKGKLLWQFPAPVKKSATKPEPKPDDPEGSAAPDEKNEEDQAAPAPGLDPKPQAFSYAAPAIKDGVLYVGNLDGYMYAINTSDGSLRWRFKTGGGVTSSALVDSGKVYFGSKDDHLYALDADSGSKVIWKFKTGGDVLSSPKIHEGTLYVGSNDKNFYALDPETGKEKCHLTTQGEVISYGVFYKDLTFFSGGQGDGHIYAMESATCKPFFKYKTGYKIESDPVLKGDKLFVTSGDHRLYAFKINKTSKK